jgi:hypothetical protein
MEIIPKPKRKLPSPEILFLYFSISIFLILALFFFRLWSLEKSKTKELSQIEEKISTLKSSPKSLEEEVVLKYYRKIPAFSNLIKDFFFPSRIFSYLEKNTHKRVYFKSAEIDFENSKIFLSGQSPDFSSLAQQLEILRKGPFSKVDLKEVSLGKEGKAEFKIEINFEKDILK